MPDLAKKNKGGDGSTLANVLDKKNEVIGYELLEEEKLPGSRVRFKVKVADESFAPRLEETLKEFTRQVRVDGFRPGKAPKHLVRNRFEAPAREETVKRMVGRLVEQFTGEKGHTLVGQPYLLDMKSSKEDGTVVELAIEVQPNIVASEEHLKDLTAEAHRIKIDDDFVNQAIERLRGESATYEAVEEGFQEKDGILFNCSVYDGNGAQIFERSADQHYTINADEDLPEEVAKALVGKKKGDTLELDIVEKNEEGADEKVHYEVEVLEVKRRVLPALDDDFAQDVSEEYNTLEDLRKGTREKATQAEAQRQETEVVNSVLKTLRERMDFDLPRTLIEQQANRQIQEMEARLNQVGVSLRSMGQDILRNYAATVQEQAKTTVKNFFVTSAVAKALDIKPTEEQINAKLEELAKSSGRKALAIRAQLEAKKQWDGFLEQLTIEAVNAELVKRTNVTYKDVTQEEFVAAQRKAQEEQAAKLRGESVE